MCLLPYGFLQAAESQPTFFCPKTMMSSLSTFVNSGRTLLKLLVWFIFSSGFKDKQSLKGLFRCYFSYYYHYDDDDYYYDDAIE